MLRISGAKGLFGRTAIVVTCCASMLFMTRQASASTILFENFDNVANLVPAGWAIVNNSAPPGTTDWFQGNPAVFTSQSGVANSYVAANFEAAAFGGNISDWLISPQLTFQNGDVISFWARTETGSPAPDRLDLRLSLNGASTNVGSTNASVGDFSTLLLSINPALTPGGFPESWALFQATLSGLGGPTGGRFAFRYNVVDTSANGDYIGIDTVRVTQSDVPEPSTLALLSAGLVSAARVRRRRNRS
jgi:PEP-CTERM motif